MRFLAYVAPLILLGMAACDGPQYPELEALTDDEVRAQLADDIRTTTAVIVQATLDGGSVDLPCETNGSPRSWSVVHEAPTPGSPTGLLASWTLDSSYCLKDRRTGLYLYMTSSDPNGEQATIVGQYWIGDIGSALFDGARVRGFVSFTATFDFSTNAIGPIDGKEMDLDVNSFPFPVEALAAANPHD